MFLHTWLPLFLHEFLHKGTCDALTSHFYLQKNYVVSQPQASLSARLCAGSHTLSINPCQLASRQALEASLKWVIWGWDGIDSIRPQQC